MAPEAGETAEAAPEAQRRGDARGGQRTASSAHGDRGDGGRLESGDPLNCLVDRAPQIHHTS